MSETTAVMKVKPWSKDQGDFVEINETDFNPEVHERFEEVKAESKSQAKRKAALSASE